MQLLWPLMIPQSPRWKLAGDPESSWEGGAALWPPGLVLLPGPCLQGGPVFAGAPGGVASGAAAGAAMI